MKTKMPTILTNEQDLSGDITFSVANDTGEPIEMLALCGNGDIKVKGRLTTNDMEVVEAFKEFLLMSNKNRQA